MKKRKIDQAVSRQAAPDSLKERPLFWVLLLCLLVAGSIVVSITLLGDILGRFSAEETNVIALVPPEEARSRSGEAGEGSLSAAGARRKEPEESAVLDGASSAGYTDGFNGDTDDQSDENHGEVQISDDVKTWNSETRVNLFKKNYDGTVKSGDGAKVIAPGTSNYYTFTLKNNGNMSLDYTVSLEIEMFLGEEACSEIPLEWRLLSGDGAAVSEWQRYNERKQVLEQAVLDVRHQDNYTIEWRWDFDRGDDADKTDTGLGNTAVEQLIGVNAVIYVSAEQKTDENGRMPGDEKTTEDERISGSREGPRTGDTSNIFLYLVLLTGSFCILLIIFAAQKRRKDEETEG